MSDLNHVQFLGTIKTFRVSGDAADETLQIVIETACTERRLADLLALGLMKQRGQVDVGIAPLFVQKGLFDEERETPPAPRCETCLQDGSEDLPLDQDLGQCPACQKRVPIGASFEACSGCGGSGKARDEMGDILTNGETQPCEPCHASGFLRTRCLYTLGSDDERSEFARSILDSSVVECGQPLPCAQHPESLAPAGGAEDGDDLADLCGHEDCSKPAWSNGRCVEHQSEVRGTAPEKPKRGRKKSAPGSGE